MEDSPRDGDRARRPRPDVGAEPHIKARLADVPGGRVYGGIWPYLREVVTADT